MAGATRTIATPTRIANQLANRGGKARNNATQLTIFAEPGGWRAIAHIGPHRVQISALTTGRTSYLLVQTPRGRLTVLPEVSNQVLLKVSRQD